MHLRKQKHKLSVGTRIVTRFLPILPVIRKGDFYTRIWTRTKNDEGTIYFPLYVEDLVDYSKLIYTQLENFITKLKQIANRKG